MKTYTDGSTYDGVEGDDKNSGNITKYIKFTDTFEDEESEDELVSF